MRESPGAEVGSGRAIESDTTLGTAQARGYALGIWGLASAGLALAVPVFGPYVAALFGYSAPMYELLGALLLGTLLLSVVAIGLGIAAMITKRGASFGMAAIMLGGIFAAWSIASFVIPALFGPLPLG